MRPYLQFKYEVKQNKYLDLIPQTQIIVYFQDLNEETAKQFIKNVGLSKLKEEIKQLIGEDGILFCSLLTKIFVFVKKVKLIGEKQINKIKNFFHQKKKEVKVVKDAIDIIRTHSFKCIKGLKPNSAKDFLKEKIDENFDAKSNWSLETKISDMNLKEKDLNDEVFDKFINGIKTYAENEEMDLEKEIGKEIGK